MSSFLPSTTFTAALLLAVLARGAHAETPWFQDIAESSGLAFTHFNGMSGEHYFAEMMGPGGALFDYDNDGDLDVYLVQGTLLGKDKRLGDALFPHSPGAPPSDRLFRNDGVAGPDGRLRLRFRDVTSESGIVGDDYGMGVATGDYDNDGWTDLYVTGFGGNRLWRNRGDGTFSDVTQKAGVDDTRWSVSAVFLDFDRDGWLDLYVGNYVNFSLANHKTCQGNSSARDYCSPLAYNPVPDRLFRNRGDGSFEDVSAGSGIVRDYGGALGVVAADFNNDGWPDLYVANDGLPNQLWINGGRGTFNNDALLGGAAVNMEGTAEASMGVDAADFDGDGDEDLFMTHLLGETNTVYVNDGQGWFEDRSLAFGLASPSKAYTSFGTGWLDFDNDGWLDLFVANGEVKTIPFLARADDPFPLHQPNQLFRNLEGRRFEEVTDRAGPVFALSEVSRGAALGDVDNDGDDDILVLNNNGPARLLLNQLGDGRAWMGFRLVNRHGRDALGARVIVVPASGSQPLVRRVSAGGSYASAKDPRVRVGLGAVDTVERVVVEWEDGQTEAWSGLPLRRYVELRQGTGREAPGAAAGGG